MLVYFISGDSNAGIDICNPLTLVIKSASEKAETLLESATIPDPLEINELGKIIEQIGEGASRSPPSAQDMPDIVELLEMCTELIQNSSSIAEKLGTGMIKSIEILRMGEPKSLAVEEKSEIIVILEKVSRSVTEDSPITTSSIAVRSLTLNDTTVLVAPEAIQNEDLPITIVPGNQRGKKANIAVMDESFKRILPNPKNPGSTLSSPIVSLNFMETEIGTKDKLDFSLVFQQKGVSASSENYIKRECVYLDVTANEWLRDGCITVIHRDKTCTCTCSHATSFAVLLSPTAVTDPTQDIVSYFMSGINLTFLVITFSLIAPFKKLRNKQVVLIQLNLILALILGNVSFTSLSASTKITVDESGNPLLSLNIGCVAGVIITQYFFLSALCWMGCTAWSFFEKTVRAVKSYGKKDKFFFHKCAAMSWMLPLIFPMAAFLTWLMMNGEDYSMPYVGASRRNDTICWVESPWKYFGFMVPAYTILVFNCVCFGLVARVIVQSSSSGNKAPNLAKSVKALMIVAVSVGCPWIVSALAVGPLAEVMQYLFIMLTGLQGPLLFIGMVLFQEDIKAHTFALFGIKPAPKSKEKVTRVDVEISSNTYATTSQQNTTKKEKEEDMIQTNA